MVWIDCDDVERDGGDAEDGNREDDDGYDDWYEDKYGDGYDDWYEHE